MTASEDGRGELDDEGLLERASELGRVLFSQDEDLLRIAARWRDSGRGFSGLIYAHQLDITLGRAVSDLEIVAKVLNPEETKNRVLFLPL